MIVKSKTPLGRGGRRRSLTSATHGSNVFSPRSRKISNGSSFIKKSSVDSCMKVVVRVRPENEREQSENFHTVVRSLDKHLLVFDPKEGESDFYFHGKKQVRRDLLKRPNRDLKFAFDHVFGPQESNQDVFESTTKSIIDGLLNGYNCSVFAYGATGAGKTHTMLGTPFNPGLTFLTVMELYQRIESIKENKICDISVSYLEVYNETIRDLLMPSSPLAVREDPQRGVVVSGLSHHKPKDAEHLLNMLDFGNKNRTQHPTDANAESSRSHAVFQVCVKQQDRTADLSTNVRVAKMSLIDLAGSERACAAAAHGGVRQREGANINKSLLALGNCINALADRKNKGQHIPYRNSKLTRILKDCLGGNCKTVMIAAVSPSSISYEDTYNTLKYADRAKSIQLDLKKNVISVEAHVTKYVKIVDDLKKEILELKEKLSVYEREKMFPKNVQATVETRKDSTQQPDVTCGKQVCLSESEIEEFTLYGTKMSALFKEGQRMRRTYLECESSLKQIQGKIQWRMTYLDRISLLSKDKDKLSKSTSKADAAVCSLKGKQARLEARKIDLMNELQKNIEELNKLKQEIENYYTEHRNEKLVYENLKLKFHQHCLEMEVRDLHQQNRHSQQIAMMLETEACRTERLLSSTLKLVRQLEMLLDGHGFLTSDLKSLYECLVKQAEGEKGVIWADESRKSGGLLELIHLLTLSTYSVLPSTPTSQPTCTPLITILNPSPNTENNNMSNFINPKSSEENLALRLSPVEEISILKGLQVQN